MAWVIAGLKIKKFSLSIRSKLLLISAVLFVVPWVGVQYIQEMEDFLRVKQESNLLGRAQIVAAVLQGQSEMFKADVRVDSPDIEAMTEHGIKEPVEEASHLYVRPLKRAIQLDGYMDDWLDFGNKAQSLFSKNKSSIQSRYYVGTYKKYLYIILEVIDDKRVYRQSNSLSLDKSDHLKIVLRDKQGQIKHYIIATSAPGWVNAYLMEVDQNEWLAVSPELRIKGEWQETLKGYNIEIRIPLALVGENLSFFIADVDDVNSAEIESVIGSSPSPDLPGTVIIATAEVDSMLQRVVRPASRTWVVDKHNRVLAVAGDLKQGEYSSAEETSYNKTGILTGIVRSVYRLLLKQPAQNFEDELQSASYLQVQSVQSALQGKAATSWRDTPDKRARILTASYPVMKNGKTIGVIAIEETSNAILIFQNRAMEILINLSVMTFLITVVVLLGYATRLSVRIMRLRDETERAITPEGRIAGNIKRSGQQDEIGDLSRSFSDMLLRLSEYNRYLESMAGKLSHELRTPITVVRSSLENLSDTADEEERQTYLLRASEGVERLSDILSRMSEATRLEQTLQSESRRKMNLCQLIDACVSGYRLAYSNVEFQLEIQQGMKGYIKGAAELLAQMLDKLVSNAVDFHTHSTPVQITLSEKRHSIQLSVINMGEHLPEKMRENLFESMVSVRSKRDNKPHLGLGLYIVRMIVEFHQARVEALNIADNKGVEFRITLPAVDED